MRSWELGMRGGCRRGHVKHGFWDGPERLDRILTDGGRKKILQVEKETVKFWAILRFLGFFFLIAILPKKNYHLILILRLYKESINIDFWGEWVWLL